ncbi:MAG: precorrin-2 C(20)-methyltransferase [Desulfomonilaceae bacterium]|nr:precorrin-2 C(20)-methyltransferase [Desulfomonilaceae bacterium]
MKTRCGTLYGIGVGPGDPDLITVKALRILKSVSAIFAASSTKNGYSLAETIVKKHLGYTPVERMPFPMTRDKELLAKHWEANAGRVLEVLNEGDDAAFVTLGDPSTYSTFTYLVRSVRRIAPHVPVVTVPGITSYHAAAALSNTPLTEGEESFHLISGANGGRNLRKIIESSENVVVLKTYKYFDDIFDTLEDLDLVDRSILVSRMGLEDETVVEDLRSLKGKTLPYLSLVIIKKRNRT